ncbi:type II toxin-antitoxin system HicA family toxin [Candidatus Woesearchaeota archaeon]|nr:type II toxin-antitoxin system HicA family toxin [Candidatus Woesearchaeota archaeon]
MPRLIPVSGKEMCRILERLGFFRARQRGSHVWHEHPDGRCVSVPVHSNRPLGKGLIIAILEEAKISREDYERLR